MKKPECAKGPSPAQNPIFETKGTPQVEQGVGKLPIPEPEDKPIPSCTLSDIMDKLDRHSSALDLMKSRAEVRHEEISKLLYALSEIRPIGGNNTIKEADIAT